MEDKKLIIPSHNWHRRLEGRGANGSDIIVFDLFSYRPDMPQGYYFAPTAALMNYTDDELYDYIFEYASDS